MDGKARTAIRRKILAWYDCHRRDLPWRRNAKDAYAQWVAEIMLQQTRVETVAAYYERFLKRFPSVGSLAAASRQTVLKHWEGLGYYRRAVNLHAAAKVLADGNQQMPESAAKLRELPGIGEYTAAAIASIAYNEPVAAVDGNVMRVISRVFGVGDDFRTLRGRRTIGELAGQLISRRRPGDFNQALMDLGSAVCTPRLAKCGDCPLTRECLAFRLGRQEELPVVGAKRKPISCKLIAVLFISDGRVLMRRRPDGGLWSGMWEPPSLAHEGGRASTTLERLADSEGLSEHGGFQCMGQVTHQLTHRSLVLDVYLCIAGLNPLSKPPDKERVWCNEGQLRRLPISTAHRKILALMPKLSGLSVCGAA